MKLRWLCLSSSLKANHAKIQKGRTSWLDNEQNDLWYNKNLAWNVLHNHNNLARIVLLLRTKRKSIDVYRHEVNSQTEPVGMSPFTLQTVYVKVQSRHFRGSVIHGQKTSGINCIAFKKGNTGPVTNYCQQCCIRSKKLYEPSYSKTFFKWLERRWRYFRLDQWQSWPRVMQQPLRCQLRSQCLL